MKHLRAHGTRAVTAATSLLLIITAASEVRGEGPIQLLRDPGFAQGLDLLAARPGNAIVVGHLGRRGQEQPSAWQLAQWNSRFPFTNTTVLAPGADLCLSNQAHWVCVQGRTGATASLTLGVDSRPEYESAPRQKPTDPWVHLLVQQTIDGSPRLDEAGQLRLGFEARLLEAETFRPPGYSSGLHAAQFQVVLTLGNVRLGSPGYGDFLWFVVPVYDDRHEVPPEYVARDFAEARGKLIYNPGRAALTDGTLHVGSWIAVAVDLKPWLLRALQAAWVKGYLQDSRNPADYRITSLNLGWEVPGYHRVTMVLRGLSLSAD